VRQPRRRQQQARQADLAAARRAEHVNLGIPAYRDFTTTLDP
jgi:hypothetical protein